MRYTTPNDDSSCCARTGTRRAQCTWTTFKTVWTFWSTVGGALALTRPLSSRYSQGTGTAPTAGAATDELNAARDGAIEEYLAIAFLMGADRNRYGKLIEDLENAFTQGQDNYPRTVTGAYATC
jgi:hypothetical protein